MIRGKHIVKGESGQKVSSTHFWSVKPDPQNDSIYGTRIEKEGELESSPSFLPLSDCSKGQGINVALIIIIAWAIVGRDWSEYFKINPDKMSKNSEEVISFLPNQWHSWLLFPSESSQFSCSTKWTQRHPTMIFTTFQPNVVRLLGGLFSRLNAITAIEIWSRS